MFISFFHFVDKSPCQQVLAQALASAGSQPGALEDARQLLSYSLLHPAINGEERRALTQWLTALHSRLPRNTREGTLI